MASSIQVDTAVQGRCKSEVVVGSYLGLVEAADDDKSTGLRCVVCATKARPTSTTETLT